VNDCSRLILNDGLTNYRYYAGRFEVLVGAG